MKYGATLATVFILVIAVQVQAKTKPLNYTATGGFELLCLPFQTAPLRTR